MERRIAVLSLLLSWGLSCFGQSSPVIWESETMKDLRTSEESTFTCLFKIYPNDRVEWVQGEAVETYTLTSTTGTLPEIGAGTVIYYLLKDGVTGRVVVERVNEEDVTLTLDWSENTELGAYYKFKVFRR